MNVRERLFHAGPGPLGDGGYDAPSANAKLWVPPEFANSTVSPTWIGGGGAGVNWKSDAVIVVSSAASAGITAAASAVRTMTVTAPLLIASCYASQARNVRSRAGVSNRRGPGSAAVCGRGGDVATAVLTRRHFLNLAAGAALSAGEVDRLADGAATAVDWRSRLREPRRLYSRRGRLALTLEAEEQEVFVAGQLRKAIVYNGSFPGPTLVVDPGDRIALTLVNRLADATNLHTHGFHVSPEGNSDNVLLHIEPGETFDYEFDLPRNHAPGLNWYHPHAHGHGTRQMFGGMAGAVIFRSRAERRGALPPMRDRVLVLQAPEWDEAGELKTWSAGLLATQLRLINGQLNPRIPIREGETQRWRILNATVSDFFDLRLDGHRLVQIAADGNPFERALELDTVHIPPGGRAEVLVEGGAPGSYTLRALPFDHGAGFVAPELVLATVDASPGRWWRRPVRPRRLLEPFCDLRERPVANRRTLTFTMRGGFLIDGKRFDPESRRPVRGARHRRGVDGRQRQPARASLPHPRQPVPAHARQRHARRRARLPRHRLDRAARRQHHLPHAVRWTSRGGRCSTATSSRTPISG